MAVNLVCVLVGCSSIFAATIVRLTDTYTQLGVSMLRLQSSGTLYHLTCALLQLVDVNSEQRLKTHLLRQAYATTISDDSAINLRIFPDCTVPSLPFPSLPSPLLYSALSSKPTRGLIAHLTENCAKNDDYIFR